ncbi:MULTISPECIES: hypothetical protein [unclassified Meiothermus]|uniref:hypothetical protein n=1 Tax=unclassified Meiothermus TaxID=370471 RepID=UPI000D7C180B|nr:MULTISPECIES: hypothetical protein [unclassified Meiothermus]PZA06234.1 hypothetical protein DNA98_14100 [Meiothermus sp. Pnk-1]RYM39506.1 hypothetical protein EWH23_03185 [Meiothermus sp. PNK-Is4]
MLHPLYLPGEPHPADAAPLRDLPLLVLVGLTGVGKSSVLRALEYPTLPDRREVVDRYVLPLFGAKPPLDRAARFALTRRFREEHPGGVAEALANAHARPTWPLLFDGLRGRAEVGYALEHLPKSYFIVLEAKDLTRLSRLLHRRDSFDQMQVGSADLKAIHELAQGVLSQDELEQALSWGIPPEDLIAKLKIVAEERKNYDPEGARQVLQNSPRALFLDTEALTIEEEVEAIRSFVGRLAFRGSPL